MTETIPEAAVVSLDTLGGGAAVERFNYELSRVLENILDLNTNPTAGRQVQLRKDGELPQVALFETADRGWELKAIKLIRQFLQDAMPDVPIIA